MKKKLTCQCFGNRKWVWHSDTLTPYNLNHIKKLSVRMRRMEAKMQWGKIWRACAVWSSLSLSLLYHNHIPITVRNLTLKWILSTFVNWKSIMYNYFANDHHELLLDNLLLSCKVLNINTPRKQKQLKETKNSEIPKWKHLLNIT